MIIIILYFSFPISHSWKFLVWAITLYIRERCWYSISMIWSAQQSNTAIYISTATWFIVLTRILFESFYPQTERETTTHWTCEQCWWRGRSPGSSPVWRRTRSSCRGHWPCWPAYTCWTWCPPWCPSPVSKE